MGQGQMPSSQMAGQPMQMNPMMQQGQMPMDMFGQPRGSLMQMLYGGMR